MKLGFGVQGWGFREVQGYGIWELGGKGKGFEFRLRALGKE